MSVNNVAAGTSAQITGAIREAAQSTGTSFEYLLTTARIESSLDTTAQATTSSAQGLYQFIQQTWLATMKHAGPALGFGRYADSIVQNADGTYEVADPSMRSGIMGLRADPAASAMMAGAFARNNANQLASALGRTPSEGELYIAHFLGSDGAGKLIGAAAAGQTGSAADMFPQAAAANRAIFYDRSGRPRTAREVYGVLTGRYDAARALSFSPAQRAPQVAPDTAGVTQAFAKANDALPPLPDTKPLFQAMFTDRAQRAVARTVSDLWAPQTAEAPSVTKPDLRLGLFTDSHADTRRLFGNKS